MSKSDKSSHPDNKSGPWSVDQRCIRCDAARHWGASLITLDSIGKSFVSRQPQTPSEEQAMWRAAVACPTQSIHRHNIKRAADTVFPVELAPNVLALGHNSRNSFGAHSYLIERTEGNLLTDSPRFQRSLVDEVERRGGVSHVLLGHKDDVGDAERWARHFDARVWIHADDSAVAPYATDVIAESSATIAPGVKALHAPGHTRGHLVFHIDSRWLFTGDTLHYNPRRRELDVTPKQTWHSWETLSTTMDLLATLHVEGVFPTHGMWCLLDHADYHHQMKQLGPAMRAAGQNAWSKRPGTTFGWY